MGTIATQRLLVILSLLIVLPMGFISKSYTGFAQPWVNNFAGDILYEIFWCLFAFLVVPGRTVSQISLSVFVFTCGLEFLQLWHPPVLEQIRSTFLGRTLIGTSFDWWDLPHYAVGCMLGWLWLRQIREYGR